MDAYICTLARSSRGPKKKAQPSTHLYSVQRTGPDNVNAVLVVGGCCLTRHPPQCTASPTTTDLYYSTQTSQGGGPCTRLVHFLKHLLPNICLCVSATVGIHPDAQSPPPPRTCATLLRPAKVEYRVHDLYIFSKHLSIFHIIITQGGSRQTWGLGQ